MGPNTKFNWCEMLKRVLIALKTQPCTRNVRKLSNHHATNSRFHKLQLHKAKQLDHVLQRYSLSKYILQRRRNLQSQSINKPGLTTCYFYFLYLLISILDTRDTKSEKIIFTDKTQDHRKTNFPVRNFSCIVNSALVAYEGK